MTTLIIILAYILSVFISRFFSYLEFKIEGWQYTHWLIWLIPIFNIPLSLLCLIISIVESSDNWFTGKNW